MNEFGFTINLPPRTKKNSSRMIKNQKTGKSFPVPSEAFINYQNNAGYFIKNRGAMINEPCEVVALFYMDTRRKVDLTNLLEAIDDILVHYGVLADDNSNIIVSHDGSRVLYDKENPRTEVTIRPI